MNRLTKEVLQINDLILQKTGIDLKVSSFCELKQHFPRNSFIADKSTSDSFLVLKWVKALGKKEIVNLLAEKKKYVDDRKNMHREVLDRNKEIFNLYCQSVASSTKFNKSEIARQYSISSSTIFASIRVEIKLLKQDRFTVDLLIKKALLLNARGYTDRLICAHIPKFAVLMAESDVHKSIYDKQKDPCKAQSQLHDLEYKKDKWDSVDVYKSLHRSVLVWDGSKMHLRFRDRSPID